MPKAKIATTMASDTAIWATRIQRFRADRVVDSITDSDGGGTCGDRAYPERITPHYPSERSHNGPGSRSYVLMREVRGSRVVRTGGGARHSQYRYPCTRRSR